MVKIMAEENLNWETSPRIINETVLATKEFLEKLIADTPYRNRLPKCVQLLWSDDVAFQDSKTNETSQWRDLSTYIQVGERPAVINLSRQL